VVTVPTVKRKLVRLPECIRSYRLHTLGLKKPQKLAHYLLFIIIAF